MLEWILRWACADWIHVAYIGTIETYEHGNEPSGSMKGREFF